MYKYVISKVAEIAESVRMLVFHRAARNVYVPRARAYILARAKPAQSANPRPRWHPLEFAAQGNSSGQSPDSHTALFRLLKYAASRVTTTPMTGCPFCVLERQEDGQAPQLPA